MIYQPDHRLFASGLALFDQVSPAQFPKTILRYRHNKAARDIGLESLDDQAWISHFGRFKALEPSQPDPMALRYHGHQFRHYNPDLGDGRGFLWAQMREAQGRLLDLGTKGSGTTPYSRRGDGRLTLKGGVREVLATTMLEALGVNSSRSFSLIETGEDLVRYDEPSPTRSGILFRLSHSHIRIGTFERLAYLEDKATLNDLVAYVCATYYPQIAPEPLSLFQAVIDAMAKTCAQWMAAGFVHGVLNSDNLNITGESFDYGPYRFLPHYDPRFTAAYFDEGGLYAYGRQADAVFWNIGQLGRALSLICESDGLISAYQGFEAAYHRHLHQAFCARLNLKPKGFEADNQMITQLFHTLEGHKTPGSFETLFYTVFFGHDLSLAAIKGYEVADPSKHELKTPMQTLLIDEIEAIWAQIAEHDDWQPFYDKLAAIETYGEALGLR